jgi:Lsr2
MVGMIVLRAGGRAFRCGCALVQPVVPMMVRGYCEEWSSRGPEGARGGRRGSAGGLNATEVREWAKAQGIEVKDRGRVPAELVVKFRAATGQ